MRCTAIAELTGKQCRMFALFGEDKCVMHSQSDVGKKYRQRPAKAFTKKEIIAELQLQLRKVKNAEIEALEKSREVRALLYQINNLKTDDESPENKEKEPEKKDGTLEEKVDQWEKDKKK